MPERKRYAIVGTGGRAAMFRNAICEAYADHAELVALCDISATRMGVHNDEIRARFGREPVPTYHADDFDRMIAEAKPDVVIVTTMDAKHHEYIVRAMDHGCDAITEKPMTTDEVKCKAIFDAIERTGRRLRVTFNYRFQPGFTKIRELVRDGAIGNPTSVVFTWMLDTSHGADYFRRWHREKLCSGGLLVHKATHHFDLVNFWINSLPQRVFAMGDLKFYGEANAARRGERYPYDRYTDEPAAENDPFALNLHKREGLRKLYLDAEADSGYIRDRNVFGGEDKWPITTEDTMAVTARYRNGVILSYNLLAYSPWEGERVIITGDRGQIEYFSRGKGHIISGQSDAELAAEQNQYQGEKYLRLQPMFGQVRDVEIPKASGGHGGGDPVLLDHVFLPDPPKDPFNRAASHIDGAASILLGVAANRAIETGQPVDVDDLFPIPEVEGEAAAARP